MFALPHLSFAVALLCCPYQAAPPQTSGALQFEVDPRVELLAAVQSVSNYNERYSLLTRFDFPYKRAFEDYFMPFRNHPVVALFDSMSADGFSFDAPPTLMLHLSQPPELTPSIPIPPDIIRRAGGVERMESFLAALRDFARTTEFGHFFVSQAAQITDIVERAKLAAGDADYVATLEAYYGMRQRGYHIVLAPLFHHGGYGPRVEWPDGEYELYNIAGPQGVEDDIPVFGSPANLRHTALHEFGHSFVNPTTAAFRSEISKYEALYEPIHERMTAMAYSNWETCVNEHLVRAVTTRMAYQRDGDEAGRQAAETERNRGFIYVPALADKLVSYENHRESYPSFADFYPEILSVFEDLSHRDVTREFGLDKFRGTLNAVFELPRSTVLIVPTRESNAETQAKIHEYVDQIQRSLFKEAILLTDSTALESDLSANSIVAYGTLQGNRWLARLADELPVVIEPTRIVADSVYVGERLRFITAWPNPSNPARGIAIYTAQRAEDIVGINRVFHGPTDYVIAKGSDRLGEGFYDKSQRAWSF